jgi:hypothetical protein
MVGGDPGVPMSHSNTHITIYLIYKNQPIVFSYTIFPVKNKCLKIYKFMGKSLFNYSFYSHPEIGKFQGVTVFMLYEFE